MESMNATTAEAQNFRAKKPETRTPTKEELAEKIKRSDTAELFDAIVNLDAKAVELEASINALTKDQHIENLPPESQALIREMASKIWELKTVVEHLTAIREQKLAEETTGRAQLHTIGEEDVEDALRTLPN
jgi:hypothetical protein